MAPHPDGCPRPIGTHLADEGVPDFPILPVNGLEVRAISKAVVTCGGGHPSALGSAVQPLTAPLFPVPSSKQTKEPHLPNRIGMVGMAAPG